MFFVGGVSADTFREHQQNGKPMPSLHSPIWAPTPETTIKTGVTTMSSAVLELMSGKPRAKPTDEKSGR
jgi:hypothetical protein